MTDNGRSAARQRTRPRQQDSSDRLAFLAEVATLYYVDKLNQEQIARQIGRSVSMVSRLLAEAHEQGVVEVRVHHPVPTVPDLQAALADRFGLRTARVLSTAGQDPHRLLPRLGELAAGFVKAILTDGAIVGVGWGTTLYEVARSVTPGAAQGIQVVQSLGSLGSRLPAIDNHLITRLLADRLGGTPHYLHAPMIVESEAVREILVQDPNIGETLAMGRRADVVLLGIGVPEPEHAGLLRAGYVDAGTLEAIRAAGAVGDICVTYFDRAGRLLDIEVSRRVVGVRLDEMGDVGTTVAVAGGAHKAPAILGALRTGLLHALVTDDETARAVLALAEQDQLDGFAQRGQGVEPAGTEGGGGAVREPISRR